MTGLSQWKRMLQKLGKPEQPRAERESATGLAAQYGLGSAFTSAAIKDVSATGIYLVTEKRLQTNELITLVLREEGIPEKSSELQFSVHARVVRQGEEGIGLSFVLPPGLDQNLWGVMVRNIVTLTAPDQIAEMFRTLRTILFLSRLCPTDAGEAIQLLGGRFDRQRVATIVKIALGAENMLASEPDFDRRRADPKLLAKILHEGSWNADEPITKLWTGLLVSSCSIDEPDDSNQVFVKLLIHVGPELVRIFVHACEQALLSTKGSESSTSSSVVVTADELITITHVSDVGRNASSIAYLYNLGLVRTAPNFSSYHPLDQFDVAPTRMGLELYKHCQGDRGKVDSELVETAEKFLRDFVDQTQPIIRIGE
jgi:hypothetical protein